MKNFYQRSTARGIILSVLLIGTMLFVPCLTVYAGMGYYPFDSFSESLMKWIAYIMLGLPLIGILFILPFQLANIIKLFKKSELMMTEIKESFKIKKIVFYIIIYSLFFYWLFTSDSSFVAIGRGITGFVIGMFLAACPIILIGINDKELQKVKSACLKYLQQNQEIIDWAGGIENLVPKFQLPIIVKKQKQIMEKQKPKYWFLIKTTNPIKD